jgi:hypothetical protein
LKNRQHRDDENLLAEPQIQKRHFPRQSQMKKPCNRYALCSQLVSALAKEHFAVEFTFETDCWDVHDALLMRDAIPCALCSIRGTLSGTTPR